MLRFRPAEDAAVPPGDVADLFAVGQLIDGALQPGHFFADPALRLTWIAARAETIPWEIFRGRLLPRSQTREERSFLTWHVVESIDGVLAAEPTISVKLDVHIRQIHVTRGFQAYVWEGIEAAGVIESREAIQWTRELVGTIFLEQFAELESVRDELNCLLWQAVVGTSRLPLTSVEAPLPAYTFGQLHYRHRAEAGDQPVTSWEQLVAGFRDADLGAAEPIKILEFVLRRITSAEVPRFVDVLLASHPRGWAVGELREFWQRMFNAVSLSPWTPFVGNALSAIDLIAERAAIGPDERIDFLSYLQRLVGRHLTAYDLVTFHHRGANYPDALLLDALLRRYLEAIDRFPDRFAGDDAQVRRRALRQTCLMRRHYEGHLVPDAPTSPGENARLLPASHPRVPEEQLLQTVRRRKQLFADDPLVALVTPAVREVLAQSVRDLVDADERAEMGRGIFIDRPLGYAKMPAEPDSTPLLAHEAFSASLARRRWRELRKLLDECGITSNLASLGSFFEGDEWTRGLPHVALADCPRPVAALADVRKVADDFVILRTLPGGLAELLGLFNWQGLLDRHEGRIRLCVQALNDEKERVLVLYDADLRRRVELRVEAQGGFVSRAGCELPRGGLRVQRVWEDDDGGGRLVDRVIQLR